MATALSIVRGANTGLILWSQVGPMLQSLLEQGREIVAGTVITDEDLKAASIELGDDIEDLDAAIARKEARDLEAKKEGGQG